MKIRILSSREEINSVKPNEIAVHLAFRASNTDLLNLTKKAPRLEMVQIPSSYRRSISKAIGLFLEMRGAKLLEGDVWGHRKDIDEYFTVEDAIMEEIRALAANDANMDDVARQMQERAKISRNLIEYIASTKITA